MAGRIGSKGMESKGQDWEYKKINSRKNPHCI